MSAPARPVALSRLRLRLTAWYVGTLVAILTLLGAGLFFTIRGQLARQLDRSLAQATTAIAQAAQTREMESSLAQGQVVDAMEELRIPDRELYLLDGAGRAVVPGTIPPWVGRVAGDALADSLVVGDLDGGDRVSFRYRGERFSLASGRVMVAVARADEIELRERYASLIAAFGGAAGIAVILVAVGGWLLVRQSTRVAEQSMERMQRFMADAAHELRTPLTALRTRAEVTLQRPREAPQLADAMRSMGNEAARLGRVVNDLMTLARADAGDRPVLRRRMSLDDVALSSIETARAMADAKGVTLAMDRFEEAWIEGDPALIHQLLVIFLDNAIKFTPPGGQVTMSVALDAGHPVVAVRDTGVGIGAADRPHIFDRFYRAGAARTRPEDGNGAAGGSGLGLSIAQWIADAHDATIEVASESGQGATFRTTFRLA